jgi:hypothetical protein
MMPARHRVCHARDFDNPPRGAMLARVFKEIRHVRQEPIDGHRRWFDDDVLPLELIVWYDAQDAVEGFQLCYNLGGGEHALTWRPEGGFAHNEVDSGSTGPFSNRTPILISDGAVPWDELARCFAGSAATLEPALRKLVGARLNARS